MSSTFNLLGDIVQDDSQAIFASDVMPAMVIGWLAKQTGDIEVNINSLGGSVTGGLAIANAFKSYDRGKVTANVMGVAASMASVIACAADEIKMGSGAFFMIHNPWSVAMGDAADLRKEADLLDQMKSAIIGFYQSKFTIPAMELAKLMDDETWIEAKDCALYGFNAAPLEGEFKAAARCDTRLMFAHAPAAASAFFAVKDAVSGASEPAKDAEVPAEAACTSPTEPVQGSEASEPAEPVAETKTATEPHETQAAPTEAAPAEAPQASISEPSETSPANDTTNDARWEARLAGLQAAKDKKISELKADLARLKETTEQDLAALKTDLAALAEERDGLRAAAEQLKADLADKTKALSDAQSAAEQLKSKISETERELSETKAALEVETERYRAQVGSALKQPAEELPTLQDALAKCSTPKERSALIASGKYKH